jgi:K+ transporter
MIIDIKRTVIRKKLRSFYIAIAVILIIVLVLFANLFNEDAIKISKALMIVIIIAVYLLFIIFNMLRDFNYIYFNDEGDKLVLRYFSLSILAQKKNSIEIPKRSFAGYKIEKSFAGLKERLILLQQLERKIAKYPAVSITSLTSEQKSDIVSSLDRFSQK